jgi:circadian clock protein KaiB
VSGATGRAALPASRRDPDIEYDLRLYVAGHSPGSVRAVENLARLCAEHLRGRHRVEHIDLQEHPERASEDDILAVPTLIRRRPLPVRTIVGDLSDTAQVLAGLNLQPNSGCTGSPDADPTPTP